MIQDRAGEYKTRHHSPSFQSPLLQKSTRQICALASRFFDLCFRRIHLVIATGHRCAVKDFLHDTVRAQVTQTRGRRDNNTMPEDSDSKSLDIIGKHMVTIPKRGARLSCAKQCKAPTRARAEVDIATVACAPD